MEGNYLVEFEVIHLIEVMDFHPEDGAISHSNERVVIQTVSALGILRQDLIRNFGMDVARRMITRMAYAQGYLQGLMLAECYGTRVADLAGATFHGLEGFGKATVIVKVKDPDGPSFHEEAIIHRSIDAEQHLSFIGKSETPVCWNITGFASGYHSAVRNQRIYFEEETCVGRGDSCCHIVGREFPDSESPAQVGTGFQAGDPLLLSDNLSDIRDAMTQKFLESRKKRSRSKRRELYPPKTPNDEDEPRPGVERATTLPGENRFIVSDRIMSMAVHTATQVAPLPTTVLIQGESGTGKEFFARLYPPSERTQQHSFRFLELRRVNREPA